MIISITNCCNLEYDEMNKYVCYKIPHNKISVFIFYHENWVATTNADIVIVL
jgi:hypothetical protein